LAAFELLDSERTATSDDMFAHPRLERADVEPVLLAHRRRARELLGLELPSFAHPRLATSAENMTKKTHE
jgi:hypothetical protein